MSTARASSWSVTINNPIAADEDNIAKARQQGWKVEGQLEKGEQGTPHYQLLVKTPQVRFSAVKKAFPRAHIEVARNVKALEQYVHKEDTKEAELKVTSDKYPSRERVFMLFSEWYWRKYGTMTDVALKHWDEFIRLKIEEGYYVEGIGVDPMTRSIVKRYGNSIIERTWRQFHESDKSSIDSQTDRQSIISSALEDITKDGFSTDNESVSTCGSESDV